MANKNKIDKAAKATRIILDIALFVVGLAFAAFIAWVGYKFGKSIGL
ncbi:hypothetical protein [Pumilibacter muris]|nr:hypothetical protein [Pumilibacter muris]